MMDDTRLDDAALDVLVSETVRVDAPEGFALREETEAPQGEVTSKLEEPDSVLHRRLRAMAGQDHAYIFVRLPIHGGEGTVDFSEELSVASVSAALAVLAVAVTE